MLDGLREAKPPVAIDLTTICWLVAGIQHAARCLLTCMSIVMACQLKIGEQHSTALATRSPSIVAPGTGNPQ
jgi:hypothetical protein